MALSAANPNNGTYSYRVTGDNGSTAYGVKSWTNTDKNEYWVRFYVYVPAATTCDAAYGASGAVDFYDGAVYKGRFAFGVDAASTIYRWAMYFGSYIYDDTNWSADAWHRIECKFVVDDTVGGMAVYVDGDLSMSDLDQDTTGMYIDTLRMGCTASKELGNGEFVEFDDIVGNTTQPGAYSDDAGGGDSVLVVGDLAYAQALDGPVLSQLHNLTVNDLGYVYYSYVNDGSVLKQQHNLSAAELSYSYGIDAVVINQIHNLIVSDLVYAMGLDAVTLGQAHNLVVSDLAYAYGLDALNLAGAITLTVADLDYAQSVDGVSVVQAHLLGVSDLGYTQTLDAVLLNQQHLLSVRDLLYTYGLDSIVWSGAVGDLTITCSGGGMTISVSAKGSPRITATGIPVPKITAQ